MCFTSKTLIIKSQVPNNNVKTKSWNLGQVDNTLLRILNELKTENLFIYLLKFLTQIFY